VLPLAARRASRTDIEGAIILAEADIDVRTGPNIRGSSMAVVMSCGVAVDFMRLFEVGAAFSAFGASARSPQYTCAYRACCVVEILITHDTSVF
jgi:hypothetical protein